MSLTRIEMTPQMHPSYDLIQRQVTWLLEQNHSEPVHSAVAWHWLEAAHIVGQQRICLHVRVHLQMLARAWQERQWREIIGQLIRLLLVPLGHAVQRLPIGNPGSSRVGAFTPQPVPSHISQLIAQSYSVAITANTSASGN